MTRVELTRVADEALTAMPDDVHEEVLGVIDAVAEAPGARPGPAVAFGASSWVTCSVAAGVVEVLDVGWAG